MVGRVAALIDYEETVTVESGALEPCWRPRRTQRQKIEPDTQTDRQTDRHA